MPSNKELANRVWKTPISEERLNDMHRFLVKICEEAGPREAGSDAELKASEIVKEEFEKYCDKVTTEEFKLAPRAFLSFTVLTPLFVIISIPFYWIYPIITTILTTIAIFIFYMQFMRYAQFIDIFYPKKISLNTIGEIKPKKEWKQTLMFSAHIDSAYQLNFNLYMPRVFEYFLIGLPLLMIVLFIVSLIHFIINWNGSYIEPIFRYIGIGLAVIIVPLAVMLLFFFKTKWAVMGAADNLSGIAILQGIAQTLGEKNDLVPNNTKIILVSFGSEEAGLRGAKNWVKRHEKELNRKPFYFLNFDGVAKSEDLNVIHKENTLRVKYNPEIVNLVIECGKEVGVDLERRELPFGATDGSAIVQAGFKNGATLEALDINKPEVKRKYHTINDTADEVEPEALELARKISIEFINKIDKK